MANRNETATFARLPVAKPPRTSTSEGFGKIVRLGLGEPHELVQHRIFRRDRTPPAFSVHRVKLNRAASFDTSMRLIERALDDSTGLLVIEVTDESRKDAAVHDLQRGALDWAADRQLPVLTILPSWGHAIGGVFGLAEAACVRAVFCNFRRGSRNDALTVPPTDIFKHLDISHALFQQEWQGRHVREACLRAIVRKPDG